MLELNKIYHGDCHELIKQIPDKSIDLVYIDIPYLYNMGGKGKSELGQRLDKKKRGLEKAGLADGIDYSIFDELQRVMKGIHIFIWCSKEQIRDIINYWCDKGGQ